MTSGLVAGYGYPVITLIAESSVVGLTLNGEIKRGNSLDK